MTQDGISRQVINADIEEIKGKSETEKGGKYLTLGKGKKALFAFYVYYGHAGESQEQFGFYNREFSENGFMAEVIRSAVFFDDNEMVELLGEIYQGYDPADAPELFARLKELAPGFIERMDNTVREKPGMFE